MFFIIPIGNETWIRRLPYATIGIIAVNLVIWIITNGVLANQERRREQLEQEMTEVKFQYLYKISQDDPRAFAMTPEEFNQKVDSGGVIAADSPDLQTWKTLYQQYQDLKSNSVFRKWGFTPNSFNLGKLFTSLFVHGGFLHLFFNMLFLWMVGCNIEDDWTWKIFLAVYLLSGVAATLLHGAVFPGSPVPVIGASGAVAGVMGAFMVRHFKTKIRFFYFIWIFWVRPYFGTFSLFAGIVLPFWFLQQILGAALGGDQSIAYWSHIGGFAFGAGVGASLKFLGLEKKYIEPMVEASFEKLKLPPALKQAHEKLEAGDAAAARILLVQAMAQDPRDTDAPLTLARLDAEAGHRDDAMITYNRALESALAQGSQDAALLIYGEVKERQWLRGLSEKNLYQMGGALEKADCPAEAVELYGYYADDYPQGLVRAKAINRVHLIYQSKLNDMAKAQEMLELLQRDHPDFPV